MKTEKTKSCIYRWVLKNDQPYPPPKSDQTPKTSDSWFSQELFSISLY